MKEKNELLKYLIGRFLLTLLMVWILQLIINLILRTVLIPVMERTLGLEGMMTSGAISETMRLFIISLFVVVMRLTLGSGSLTRSVLSKNFLRGLFGESLLDSLIKINDSMDSDTLYSSAIIIILFFLLLLIIWILPYAFGAFVYARRVYIKVDELEKNRINREKEFDRQRNLLLSDITHDIKTPITTIAGFSKALSDGTVSKDDEMQYLNAIYNKSILVSDLVSLLFEYIKLDSKGYTLHKTQIDIAETLRHCVADFYAEFEAKSMELDLDIPEEAVFIYADKMQIERAINNLISNTLSHNPDGTPVSIVMKRNKREIVIRLSDRGVRIDKDDAVHLFEPFVRGDKSRKSGNGNGLGLSITKKIIDMHGGRIYLIQYQNEEKYQMTKTFEIRLSAMKTMDVNAKKVGDVNAEKE